jgi:hypothetical protein
MDHAQARRVSEPEDREWSAAADGVGSADEREDLDGDPRAGAAHLGEAGQLGAHDSGPPDDLMQSSLPDDHGQVRPPLPQD